MAKSAAAAAERWNQGTQGGADAWATGIQSTTKPIVDAAIAQRSIMVSNFNLATSPGGLWEQKLRQVGDAGIKQAAMNAKGMYAAGTQKGQPKFLQAITKVIAYEQAGLPAIHSMPSGTLEAGVQRATAWIRYMAAGRGQLGAS